MTFYRHVFILFLATLFSYAAFAEEQTVEADPDALLTPEEQAILDSPTANIEKYEEVRSKFLHKSKMPGWGLDLNTSPRAFQKADLRLGGPVFNEPMPSLYGLLVGFDKILFNFPGFLSVGIDLGGYGTVPNEQKGFVGLFPAFLSAGPYAHYQLVFFQRQWVVPYGKAQYEQLRYKFTFNNKDVVGYRGLVRFEIGGLIFLNVLEPSSAGTMESNFDIKRTYLHVGYTVANDLSRADFSLSEYTYRVGFRFEY